MEIERVELVGANVGQGRGDGGGGLMRPSHGWEDGRAREEARRGKESAGVNWLPVDSREESRWRTKRDGNILGSVCEWASIG